MNYLINRLILSVSAILIFAICAVAQPLGGLEGIISDSLETLPGATVELVNITLEKPGSIAGSAIGSITDMNGRFSFRNLNPGKYTLKVRYVGYQTVSKDIIISGGKIAQSGKVLLVSEGIELQALEINANLAHGEAKANNLVRTASRVVNVMSSETIQKLPDKNASESVARLPGVALERDHGEGRFISLRGTPADWSASLMNGDRIPVASEEANSRTLAYDIFPVDLIEYIVVSKSLTPDVEGDAIGGSINFITKTAPDKRTLKASPGSGYNFQVRKPIYSGSMLYGDRIGRWGYMLSVSSWVRNWATDNFEVIYGSNFNHALNRLELRNYTGIRKTWGFNAALEYKMGDFSQVYGRLIHGRFDDEERNLKTMFNWAVGAGQTLRLQNIYNIMQTRLYGAEIGASLRLATQHYLNVRAARYENSFRFGGVPFKGKDFRNGYFVVQFERFNIDYLDQVFVDQYGNPLPSSQGALELKLIGPDYPGGNGDRWDRINPIIRQELKPEDFEFSGAYSELNDTWERDPIVLQADWKFNAAQQLKIQAGSKYRQKQGLRKLGIHEWLQNTAVSSSPLRLTHFENELADERGGFLAELGQPYRGRFLPFLTPDALDNFISGLGDTLRERYLDGQHPDYEEWVGSRYTYQENVIAGYAMADWQDNKWQVVGGVRVEQTALNMQADTVLAGIYDPVNAVFYYPIVPVETKITYTSVLPMLNIKYSPATAYNIRFALTRSFRRPNFNESKPGSPVKDFTNLEFTSGNRGLRPSYAWNADLTFEYFEGLKGLIAGGIFYKRVTDHIFASFTADADPLTGIIYKSYQNAGASFVAGAEITYNRKFDFLPGFWKGFGVNANYTYCRSEMKVPGRSKVQPFPRQAQNLFNIALFYEYKRLTMRLGVNYKGPYLLELNLASIQDSLGNPILLHQDTEFDLFMGQFVAMDFSASCDITKRWTLFMEANNLLNAPLRIYRGRPERPVQTEFYNVRGQLGVKFNL